MHLQSNSYRGLCSNSNNHNNPDGDPELECSADIQEAAAEPSPTQQPAEEAPQPESPYLRLPTPGEFMNVIPGSQTVCYFKMIQCNGDDCYLEDECKRALGKCLDEVTAQGECK